MGVPETKGICHFYLQYEPQSHMHHIDGISVRVNMRALASFPIKSLLEGTDKKVIVLKTAEGVTHFTCPIEEINQIAFFSLSGERIDKMSKPSNFLEYENGLTYRIKFVINQYMHAEIKVTTVSFATLLMEAAHAIEGKEDSEKRSIFVQLVEDWKQNYTEAEIARLKLEAQTFRCENQSDAFTKIVGSIYPLLTPIFLGSSFKS